jgi:hypothetical protein
MGLTSWSQWKLLSCRVIRRAQEGLIVWPGSSQRDPWLDGVRGTPEFAAILRRVEARHRQAVISFLTAEGDRVLGVAHPV